VAKFRGVAHSTAKVVGTNTLTIEPIFDPPFRKNCWGPLSRWGAR